VANETEQSLIYQEYTGNECNIDITALKGTLRNKKDKLESNAE
jgi:hypothetical protein